MKKKKKKKKGKSRWGIGGGWLSRALSYGGAGSTSTSTANAPTDDDANEAASTAVGRRQGRASPVTAAFAAAPTPQELEDRELGISKLVIEFVSEFAKYPSTFLHFPKQDIQDDVREKLNPTEMRHAMRMLELVPALARIRYQLVPSDLHEYYFWRVYFTLVGPHVGDCLIDNSELWLLDPEEVPSWDKVEAKLAKEVPDEAPEEIRYLARTSAMPAELRYRVWPVLSGARAHLREHSDFQAAAYRRVFRHGVPERCARIHDFGGWYRPDNFTVSEAQVDAVTRMLVVLGMEHPQVTYAPVVPDYVFLLHTYMSEVEAFAAASLMIAGALKADFHFGASRAAYVQMMAVFDILLKEREPDLHAHMNNLYVSVEEFSELWFTRGFVGSVPERLVFRLFDVVLVDGFLATLKMALAVMAAALPMLMACRDSDDFLNRLKRFAGNLRHDDARAVLDGVYTSDLTADKLQAARERVAAARTVSTTTHGASIFFRALLPDGSTIITEEELQVVWSWIPQRCRISDPRLVFQNGVHGSSLTMMYERAGDALAALLLVRTESDCVFGAFINEPFCPDVTDAQCVSGSGEMFVFSLRGTSQRFFPWRIGRPSVFVNASRDRLTIGATALIVDSDLWEGRSDKSATFQNAPLAGPDEKDFRILEVEVFAI